MYNVGRLDSEYVMFTLNPGYDIEDITVNQEEVDARKGWEEYQVYWSKIDRYNVYWSKMKI